MANLLSMSKIYFGGDNISFARGGSRSSNDTVSMDFCSDNSISLNSLADQRVLLIVLYRWCIIFIGLYITSEFSLTRTPRVCHKRTMHDRPLQSSFHTPSNHRPPDLESQCIELGWADFSFSFNISVGFIALLVKLVSKKQKFVDFSNFGISGGDMVQPVALGGCSAFNSGFGATIGQARFLTAAAELVSKPHKRNLLGETHDA